jgi:hypothetical protein
MSCMGVDDDDDDDDDGFPAKQSAEWPSIQPGRSSTSFQDNLLY